MTEASITEEIVKKLDQLPPHLQKRVLEFTQSLIPSLPKGISGKKLLQFSGVLDPKDAQEMLHAIEESCEKVDVNEW